MNTIPTTESNPKKKTSDPGGNPNLEASPFTAVNKNIKKTRAGKALAVMNLVTRKRYYHYFPPQENKPEL